MVKAIWAVACKVLAGWVLLITVGSCSSAPPNKATKAESREMPEFALSNNDSFPRQDSAPQKAETNALKDQGPPANGEPAGAKYRIGPEDVLHINTWENKELTLDVVVRPDGMISFPLIQDIRAEGLTASELANAIQTRLGAFIKVPQVFVVVTQINASKIYVLGNVLKPGQYPLRGEMSVLQALSLAGGFTPFASPRKIKIVRNIAGYVEIRRINYNEIMDDGTGNFLLRPGDTIVVP